MSKDVPHREQMDHLEVVLLPDIVSSGGTKGRVGQHEEFEFKRFLCRSACSLPQLKITGQKQITLMHWIFQC